jgi:hypothetical protein
VSLEEEELERRLPNTHDWQTMYPGENWHGSWTGPSDACAPRRPLDRPSFDLQNQRDEFALAMRVGLGKDRFQLIARRLP